MARLTKEQATRLCLNAIDSWHRDAQASIEMWVKCVELFMENGRWIGMSDDIRHSEDRLTALGKLLARLDFEGKHDEES